VGVLDELMNIREAATYLRLNTMTVYKMAQKRQIPAFKVGGDWRFKKEWLEDWLAQKAAIGRGSVLIVDDDPMIQEILKEIVVDQGYTVFLAGDGESALELLEKRHFDLVFLDLILPGVGGVDILEAIKRKDKGIVVVVVTGYADDPVALKAMALGPLLLIRKPFKEKDIVEVLSMVLKGKTV